MHPEVNYRQRPLHERVPDYDKRMRVIAHNYYMEIEMANKAPHISPINRMSLVPKEDPHAPIRYIR